MYGIQLERGEAEGSEQFPALDLGEPQDGGPLGSVAGGQGQAQGGIDRGGGLTRGEIGQFQRGHDGPAFREEDMAKI